jgi:hypothetical protein
MRYELVEPGPRWEAALRYLGMLSSEQERLTSLPDLAEILLTVIEKIEAMESRLNTLQPPTG